MACPGCGARPCRAVVARASASAGSVLPSQASWTWTDCLGRLAHYDPACRGWYIEWHETAVDVASAFGYAGA